MKGDRLQRSSTKANATENWPAPRLGACTEDHHLQLFKVHSLQYLKQHNETVMINPSKLR